jgi:hypothetical protein
VRARRRCCEVFDETSGRVEHPQALSHLRIILCLLARQPDLAHSAAPDLLGGGPRVAGLQPHVARPREPVSALDLPPLRVRSLASLATPTSSSPARRRSTSYAGSSTGWTFLCKVRVSSPELTCRRNSVRARGGSAATAAGNARLNSVR